MLEVARLMGGVREGTVTSGTVSTLVDTAMDEPADTFTGGTLFMLSGTNDNLCCVVTSHQFGGRLVIPTLTAAIAAADTYAVAPNKFPKHILKQAVNAVLRDLKVMGSNSTLTVTTDTQAYTLPSGVFDVRRVEVERDDDDLDYERNHHWKELNGVLYFDPGHEPGDTGKAIRVWYAKDHGELGDAGTVDNDVDIRYLKWAAVSYCWRNYIQGVKKDDPIAMDLLNEAKTSEAQAMRNARNNHFRIIDKDPHWGRW
jgi:hypothetical protein